MLAAAVALVCAGGFASGLATGIRLALLGIGVLAVFAGMAIVAPSITPTLTSGLGWPATKIGGAAGTLARANASRNPARTASTAAALMIGLALVTAVAVLAQGLKQSLVEAVKQEFRGDYVLTSQNGFTPTSVAAADALRRAKIATIVADERSAQARALGDTVRIAGLDPQLAQVFHLQWKHGTDKALARLGADGAILDSAFATAHHLGAGSTLTIETPAGRTKHLYVTAIYKPPQAENPLGTIAISSRTFDALYPTPQNIFSVITTPGGVSQANTARLTRVLSSFPDAKIQTEQQFISSQEAAINSELNLIYILLVLSIIVSLFGIVNTLVLTVFERTRELGMLRAIGMTRRQARRTIRHEAIITSLLGATLGIPVGIGLAALFDRALHNLPFALPWESIALFIAAAILVGLFAAIFPARHASRLNILAALQYE